MVLTQVEIGAPPLLINFGGILQGPFCHRWHVALMVEKPLRNYCGWKKSYTTWDARKPINKLWDFFHPQ